MRNQRGRPTAMIVLTAEERETLERWARRPRAAQALRSRIVLAAAAGQANIEIGAALSCHPVTAGKWRRLGGLSDEPRPGAPRTIGDEQVEAVFVKTLEQRPRNATHWSTRSMAAEMGMSQTAVSRIWCAFGLKPHLVEQFRLSPDPQFIDKVRDVAGLYLNPPEVPAPGLTRGPSSSAWTRRSRSRRWTAPRRRGQCYPACRAVRPMATYDTGPPICTPRSTTCPALDAGSPRAT